LRASSSHVHAALHGNSDTAAPLFNTSVALTGRNTTGPPSRAARGELRCAVKCYRRQQTTDDDRRQRLLLVLPSYTMCRRASKNTTRTYCMSLWVYMVSETVCKLVIYADCSHGGTDFIAV